MSATNILSLNGNLLNYIVHISHMNPRDVSHFRATCKDVHKRVIDTATEYRISTRYDCVEMACMGGFIELAKWYIDSEYGNPRRILRNHAFHVSCENGILEMVRWCYSRGSAIDYDCINFLCYMGHINILDWVVSTGYKPMLDMHLAHACRIGLSVKVAEWCVLNGATKFDWALKRATENGHLELAEWCLDQKKKHKRIKYK